MPNNLNAQPAQPNVVNLHSTNPMMTDEDVLALVNTIAEAADERKGADITILKVTEVSYLADYFVIVTGFSNAQVRAIARSIEDKVDEAWGRYPLRTEGQAEGGWILQDFGDVIVHTFLPEESFTT